MVARTQSQEFRSSVEIKNVGALPFPTKSSQNKHQARTGAFLLHSGRAGLLLPSIHTDNQRTHAHMTYSPKSFRATPQLMYLGKTVTSSPVQRNGVSKGFGVAPPEDWPTQTTKPDAAYNFTGYGESARTMGRFVVMKKSDSVISLERKNRRSRQDLLTGWEEETESAPQRFGTPVVFELSSSNSKHLLSPPSPEITQQLQKRRHRRKRRPRRVTGVAGVAGRSTTAPSKEGRRFRGYAGLVVDNRRVPEEQNAPPKRMQATSKSPRPATTGATGGTDADYIDIDPMVIQYQQTRIATPSLDKYRKRTEQHQYNMEDTNTFRRSPTGHNSNSDRNYAKKNTSNTQAHNNHARLHSGTRHVGISQHPPSLGGYTQRSTTAHSGLRSPRQRQPEYEGGLNGRAVTANNGGSPRLTEYQRRLQQNKIRLKQRREILQSRELKKKYYQKDTRRNDKWGSHPNDFKLAAASSPFSRPGVLSSPRTIYLYEDFVKPEVDETLMQGLVGGGVNGTPLPVKPASRGYAGQLFRGALVPVPKLFVRNPEQLSVGNPNLGNRKERNIHAVPIGFFAKRGIVADPKERSGSPRELEQRTRRTDLHWKVDGERMQG